MCYIYVFLNIHKAVEIGKWDFRDNIISQGRAYNERLLLTRSVSTHKSD